MTTTTSKPVRCPIPTCAVDTTEQLHFGHCIECGHHIGARTAREWSRLVKAKCPRCGRPW